MISRYTYKKITWVDLESPTKEEVLSLMEEFDIPELVGEELLRPTIRSKVDLYDNLIYLVLHFPKIHHTHGKKGHDQEVNFVIGKNFIVTGRYELIDPLHEFSKLFEVNSVLNKNKIIDHAGFIFFDMVKEMYKHSADQLNEIDQLLIEIEENIFAGHEGDMVEIISKLNGKLLNFKQAIRFHGEVLRSFDTAGRKFFGESFGYYLSAISSEHNKLKNILDSNKEMLQDLKETNDALLSKKTGDTMKTLTMMSFVMLPLSLIAVIFAMHVNLPIVGGPGDFWAVISIMAITVVATFLYFKHKKWI